MKRTITILISAIFLVAIGQDTSVPPRPSLAALENVRNLVASMRQEAIAARDVRAWVVEDMEDLQSAVETARKAVESLAGLVDARLDSNRQGLTNANAHVRAFDEELESLDRLRAKLEGAK